MKLRMLGKFCKLSRCNYQPIKIKYFIILLVFTRYWFINHGSIVYLVATKSLKPIFLKKKKKQYSLFGDMYQVEIFLILEFYMQKAAQEGPSSGCVVCTGHRSILVIQGRRLAGPFPRDPEITQLKVEKQKLRSQLIKWALHEVRGQVKSSVREQQ